MPSTMLPRSADDADPCPPTMFPAVGAAVLITVAAVLHVVAILHAEPLQSANDRSRWCTIRALIEERTYRIDNVRQIPGWDTIDLIRKDGHFYSTKPPMMATWVAAIVEGLQRVTGWTFAHDFAAINAVTLLLVNVLPFVAGLCGWAWWLRRRAMSAVTSLFVLATASFGTLISPFLTSLNNHTPAAMGLLLALLAWECASGGATSRRRRVWWALCGFGAGWAACHDLPAAAFVAVMAFLAWRQDVRALIAAFAPAAALPIAAFLVCNWLAMGSISPAYSGYGGETYRFIEAGVPSYWVQPQGIDRNLDGPIVYFLNCTVGHHGWFLLTPVWCLALAWPRSGATTSRPRLVAGMTFGLTAVVLAFYLTRTENYNYGGVSCGLRWAIFLTPLWLMTVANTADRILRGRLAKVAAVAALAVSVFSAWYPMSRAWQQPWAYQLVEQWGWVPARAAPPPLERPLFSWFAELPSISQGGEPQWVEFVRDSVDGAGQRMRLNSLGDVRVGQRTAARIEIVRYASDDEFEQRELLIDRQAFLTGKKPSETLIWRDASVTPAEQQADLAAYRGLPCLRAYHPGYERYVKLPLRGDAFATQRVAAQCDFAATEGEPARRYRADLWLSQEIPFGTARVDWTVSDPRTGEVLQRESWLAAACSPAVAPTSPVTLEMFDRPEPVFRQVGRTGP